MSFDIRGKIIDQLIEEFKASLGIDGVDVYKILTTYDRVLVKYGLLEGWEEEAGEAITEA